MSGARRIDAFVDACLQLASYRQAVADDGDPRVDVIAAAREHVRRTERMLTGGQIACARRCLARMRAEEAGKHA